MRGRYFICTGIAFRQAVKGRENMVRKVTHSVHKCKALRKDHNVDVCLLVNICTIK